LRRAFGLILLALGVFAVAGAVLLPTYVYPKLAKVPLDQDSTSVLEGTASKVLAVVDKGTGPVTEIRENAKLTAVGRVQANFAAPEMQEDTDYAVWLLAVRVTDDEDNTVVNASKRQVCFDRRTAEGYAPNGAKDPKCDARSSYVTELKDKADVVGQTPGEKNIEKAQPGLNFKFPFGTEQKDYKVYDDNTGAAVTARYTGTETVNGIETYKFVQNIQDTKVATKDVPGSLVGSDQPTVKADLFYRGVNTMWVEPVTGVEVKQQQQQHQELRSGTTSPAVVFDGTLAYNGKTISQMVDQVNANKGKLEFLSSTGPLWLAIGGGVLIIVAIVLLVRRRPAEPPAPPQRRRREPVGAGH
jgi:Porin PorA